jgi:hypothetical protein
MPGAGAIHLICFQDAAKLISMTEIRREAAFQHRTKALDFDSFKISGTTEEIRLLTPEFDSQQTALLNRSNEA